MAPNAEPALAEQLAPAAFSATLEYEQAAAEARAEEQSKGAAAAAAPGGAEEAQFEVDLSKPLVFQVGHLGDRYDDWVHKPIVSKQGPRLFESDLMEVFTNTYWWMIPLIWLPVVVYLESQALAGGIKAVKLPLYALGGIFIWTLLEYTLHRFLFHSKTSSYWLNTLHYLLHGCHHKHPQDPNRLVFPPLLCAIFSAAIVGPFTLFLTPPVVMALYGGGLFGYVCYDITHFWLHFGVPTKYPVLYGMRRYHLGHHFKHPESGYGITSPTWDHVFKTYPAKGDTAKAA